MAIERTFSIIKPDATARNLTGAINAMIEQAGLRIIAQKRVRITTRAGRDLLWRAPGAAVLRRAGRFHDLGAGGGAGAGRRERDRQVPRHHGRDRSGEGGGRTPSARFTPNRSARTRCMAPMRPTRRRRKSPSSFPATRSSADGGRMRPSRCGAGQRSAFDGRLGDAAAVAAGRGGAAGNRRSEKRGRRWTSCGRT